MPANQDAEWPFDLLQSIWDEQKGLLAERVAVIEHAVSELEEDRLREPLRAQAERAAHMLAGSIGIFGFGQAGDAARELEQELADPRLERAPVARKLLLCLQIDRGPVVSRVGS